MILSQNLKALIFFNICLDRVRRDDDTNKQTNDCKDG